MNKSKKILIVIAIILLFGWMLKDSFTQPGIKDLKGNFTELTFVRNEQNTGPVIRIYAVSLKDSLWQEMEQYGNYMPHNKYGTTKVYFFIEGKPAPVSLSLDGDNIEESFKKYCIARYEKGAMGQNSLVKYPFDSSN